MVKEPSAGRTAPSEEAAPPVRTIGPPGLTAGLAVLAHGPPLPSGHRLGAAPGPGGAYRLGLEEHRAVHGRPPRLGADELAALAGLGGLRGRGGAGFPFARKLTAVTRMAARKGTDTRLVVNATEGEPGSYKDRTLLRRVPHLVLDGAVLAADAIGSPEVVVGIASEGEVERSLVDAAAERGSGPRVRVVRLPERFLSGEGGALINGVNGRRPIPPGVKRRASDSGIDGRPTLLSNAETYAQLARLAVVGADRYGSVGAAGEPGTALFTVGGAACAPSVVEAPLGTPLAALLRLCGADAGRGVLVGGYHGAWLPPDAVPSALLSRQGMADAGGVLGAGIVLPLGPDACPIDETARILRYLAGESAGQCGPCVRGLPDLARAFTDLADGEGSVDAVRSAVEAAAGRGACAHPDGAARLAESAVSAFADDIAVHALTGSCGRVPVSVLPLPRNDPSASRLTVDWSRCAAHGLCSHLAPSVVHLDRHGYPESPSITVPPHLEPDAARAVSMCPALALRLVTDE